MQCSSLVKTNLLSLQEQFDMSIRTATPFKPTSQLLTTIHEDLEALESIYQCGLAQERISNDVLSLGRIQLGESSMGQEQAWGRADWWQICSVRSDHKSSAYTNLVEMFDVETDILGEAQKVIAIFQNEARMKRIALSYKIGESVERLGVHSIKTDPVRMGQVWVLHPRGVADASLRDDSVTNLLSNGIRFTSTSSVRKIQLTYDVSFDPPADGSCAMPGLPDPPLPGQLKDDMTVYLYVAVTDTGPGLTPKELDMLFQRFSQVSRMCPI
jgi:signal transduction histidine kinase